MSEPYRQVTVDGVRQYEHRVVMERILGRKLERHEHVHHIDGDGLNNAPENLQLLTASEHISLEKRGKPHKSEHRAKIGEAQRRSWESGRKQAERPLATHCKRGHPFNDENTYHYVTARGEPRRMCRPCASQRSLEHKRQKRKAGYL